MRVWSSVLRSRWGQATGGPCSGFAVYSTADAIAQVDLVNAGDAFNLAREGNDSAICGAFTV